MHSERQAGFESQTAELVRESKEGLVDGEAIDGLLADTAWDHSRRHTRVGMAHVFTRPVTLLEAARLDPEDYQNHRHTIGVTRDGDPHLTYLVLRDVHSSDLRALPRIESMLRGRGALTREDFSDTELALAARIWTPSSEVGRPLGMDKSASSTAITTMLRRLRLANRAELLVLGLKEGFINPDLREWRTDRIPLSARQSAVLRRGHSSAEEIAGEVGISVKSVNNSLSECYRKTGARTRGELILTGLANGECRLGELRTPAMQPTFSELEKEMLALADQPYNVLAERSGDQKTAIANRYQRICQTLGLESREELIRYAFREGYLDNGVDGELADVFSKRQREVVERLLYDNGDVAEALGISKSVVVHHLMEAKKSAGVRSRTELVAYGLRAGLIDPIRPMPAGA